MSDSESTPPGESKTARNKRRDLVAGLLNNLSSAAFIGALLQPALSFLRLSKLPTWGDAVAVLGFRFSGLFCISWRRRRRRAWRTDMLESLAMIVAVLAIAVGGSVGWLWKDGLLRRPPRER